MSKMFDFGNIGNSKAALTRTWKEFRDSLKNKEFNYDEIEKAKNITFTDTTVRILSSVNEESRLAIKELAKELI